jgi:hypothetical protein
LKFQQVAEVATIEMRNSRPKNPPLNEALYLPQLGSSKLPLSFGNAPLVSMVVLPTGMLPMSPTHCPPRVIGATLTLPPVCVTVVEAGHVRLERSSGNVKLMLPE